MAKITILSTEKDIIIEALSYYMTDATTRDDGICGLDGDSEEYKHIRAVLNRLQSL